MPATMKSVIFPLLVSSAAAFPFVMDVPGVQSDLIRNSKEARVARAHMRRQQTAEGAGSEANCPFNADHVPAAPISAEYPYNNATDGLPGLGKGGFLVPADGDTAHYYTAPNYTIDVRGPCPGLNTLANHNFLAHDGITTFNELVDAQQNVYNVGYDLAQLLALLGLTLTDGDIVTEKLSIGCDATSRTSFDPTLTGDEPGLDGHNKFEADSSLTRNDFFLDDGNDFAFNMTLFDMMTDTCDSNYDRANLAVYRNQRWHQSQQENAEFYFGPLTLLLYGAASFLYELMPSGPDYTPDYATISSFFIDEKIPDNWTNRIDPYTNELVTEEIVSMYLLDPVLFGGNTAAGAFDTINFGAIQNGTISVDISPTDTACLLYQLATGDIPSSLNGIITPTVEALAFVATKLDSSFANLGCSLALTK